MADNVPARRIRVKAPAGGGAGGVARATRLPAVDQQPAELFTKAISAPLQLTSSKASAIQRASYKIGLSRSPRRHSLSSDALRWIGLGGSFLC